MGIDVNRWATQAPIYHFKILVPPAAAGRIIGKGGATIEQLQKDAGARVKMSKASEFYPGTTERVCLISGPMEGILKINDFFMDNFSSSSIKILVPDSTAGMIIGKAGSYIKQIKEESGAYVQISQKCTELSLPERCVTIVGEPDNIRKACAMILLKIADDVGTIPPSYRDIRANSSSPSTSLTSSTSSLCSSTSASTPTITTTPIHSTSSSSSSLISTNLIQASGLTRLASAATSAATVGLQPQQAMQAATASMSSAQIIESIQLVLRVSGYGESAVSEITSAMSTLAEYGVLGVGLGLS